ncbi:hypothetical protein PanWU01x14_232280 [Parasponia andersonii]|uniref:Uncharacterized protein n=1 Tax=Parasponia andersonii TaxID=3476 RepID=A0A2P5BK25_PARAD|nr:hypothetical protein PanWU01x14_232280 [Parasponia andersonii]
MCKASWAMLDSIDTSMTPNIPSPHVFKLEALGLYILQPQGVKNNRVMVGERVIITRMHDLGKDCTIPHLPQPCLTWHEQGLGLLSYLTNCISTHVPPNQSCQLYLSSPSLL